MAILNPSPCNCHLWHARLKAIGGLFAAVAAIVTPSPLMAQSTDHSANTSIFRSCGDQPTGLPIQMAMSVQGKVEPSAGPQPASKAEAILGGQISKLEQMRLDQSSGSSAGTATISVKSLTLAEEVRNPCGPSGNERLYPESTASSVLPANAILGSMSIAIARTPFDQKWSAINTKRDSARMVRLLATTGARNSISRTEQIETVNRWVNRNIQFGEDRDIYGRSDYWATAGETFRRGIGDCEDLAIAKMELLSALGISRDQMRLVVARDLVRNADHAVLVVTLADGIVMLDNMTDRLLDARLPNDYRPIMSFSQNTKWMHGYPVQSVQPVQMTSANSVLTTAGINLGDVQTVTVEPEMPVLSMALLSVPLELPKKFSARA